MRYQLSNQTSHLDISEDLEDYIDKETAKLDPIIASFPDDTLLRVILDDAEGVDEIEVLLRLSLPSRLLTSRETGSFDHARSVFGKALKDLRRQLLEFKEQL